MKKCKITALLLVLLLLLSSCQLARENLSENAGQDLPIGFLLTTHHLDLFDSETYFFENASALLNGITVDTAAYEGKLPVSEQADGTLSFGALSGAYEYYAITREGETNAYGLMASDGVLLSGLHFLTDDEGESITAEGTVTLLSGSKNGILYMNPIYRAADGSVYAVNGNAWDVSEALSRGELLSCTLSGSISSSVNGKKTTNRTKITLHVRTEYPPENETLYVYNEAGALLNTFAYAPGAWPEQIAMPQGAAYAVLQTRLAGETAYTLAAGEDTAITPGYTVEDCLFYYTQQVNLVW